MLSEETKELLLEVLTCTRFCTGESIRHQQISPAFNKERANGSIQSSYEQQISIDFHNRLKLIRDQVLCPELPLENQ